jgi:small-conductance mechanosensitive channel
MESLTALAASNQLMAWLIPIAVVVGTTAIGWIAERLAIRWVKGIAGHGDPARELAIKRTLRGHITFWGLLLGLSLIFSTISPYLPPTLRDWYPKALTALFILSLTFMLARMAVALIRVSAASASRPVVSLISNIAWFITLVIGFMLVLSTLQIDIAPWLATLGLAGLAVSLSLQATLTDLISGMLLLGTRQIEIGNYVKLSSGEEGYIADINWRNTTIRQLGNNQIIVPNSKMTQSSVTNYHTPQPNISVPVNVGVSYSSDLDHVEQVTIEVAQDVMQTVKGGVPDFEPFIRYNNLGDFSVQFTVIMQGLEFTDQYLIKHEFIKRLFARYKQEGISIPFPIQTVRLSDAATETAAQPASAPARPHGPAKAADGAKRRA